MNGNYRDDIRLIVEDREIYYLYHFTQIVNLPEIMKHGLLSRRKLAELKCLAFTSDEYRLDENSDAVSVSISQVNERMFASKRRKSGHQDWVVLVLGSKILWTHKCQFCWSNAAKKEIKNRRGFRGGPWAFKKMFAGSNESRGNLERCYPTDPEAEVQVLENIASKYIVGAIVGRQEMAEPVNDILNELPEWLGVEVIDGF
ncbi:MAG: DUF4433 domain-containing protein [Oligoflexales bacterium]|nr:DUF4433 domain-containing protein [Oligoflexales bacterium]